MFCWIEQARKRSTDEIKNQIWAAANGQPIPGGIPLDVLRYVLRERGETGEGYHNT